MTESAAYEALGEDRFRASRLTVGPWSPEHQHAGPPSALIARAVERAAAIEDARHKAEIDAEAAGLKVIAAHSVVEESAGVFGNLARLQAQGPLLDNAANAGAIVLREGVFVSFDLGPK